MTMKDKDGRGTSSKTKDLFPDVPDPRPVTSIQVSIAADGTPSVDVDPAVVAPGGVVVWHTSADEQRPFRILFEEGSPLETSQGGTNALAHSPTGKAAMATAKPPKLEGNVTLPSRTEQVVRAAIRENAAEKMWRCTIEVDIQGQKQRIFTGIIVRPPKPRQQTAQAARVAPSG